MSPHATPSPPRIRWVPDGLMAHPLLYGSPLEAPARRRDATDARSLVRQVDGLRRSDELAVALGDKRRAIDLLEHMITAHAPR